MAEPNKLSIDDLYYILDNELKNVEQDFMALEKKYFELISDYEKINANLNTILNTAVKTRSDNFVKRVIDLIYSIKNLRKKRGYDSHEFQAIHKDIRTAVKKCPNEIIDTKIQRKLKKRLERKARSLLKEKLLSARLEMNNAVKFLMVKNGKMAFLIPYLEKVWQADVKAKKEVKLQIKRINPPNIYSFQYLPGYTSYETKPNTKKAVLLKQKSEKLAGYLLDEIKGTMVLSKNLLQKKLKRMPIRQDAYGLYIKIRGERYFIRDGEEMKLYQS
ncbi:MAG: hypothetical protein OEZ13_02760 [Spirochaetia bacterium]|nr:hypothetical protein [Spirochaetia bacterium]